MSTEESREPPVQTIRRSTRLELGLVAALVVNVAVVVAFATSMATRVDTIIETVDRLSADMRVLTSDASTSAVLRYRVEQLERHIETLQRNP